ncbi:MAG TPA: LytR C-terminal domain-containing protein [Acidimicrobiia bacterium]|nr:LytR C-terminal domain-containing protein [Acidimicrobiia bacterium]
MTDPGDATELEAPRRRPPPGSSFTRSMLGAFVRGTGLVALALVIGLVLLQWSDGSTDAAAGGITPPTGTPVAVTEPPATTPSTVAGPRPPADVAVLVLNGTGKNNQAKPMSDRLAVVGYHTLTPGTTAKRADSVVLCRPGLDREATALVAATGLPATTAVLDDAARGGFTVTDSAAADCVVVIGAR